MRNKLEFGKWKWNEAALNRDNWMKMNVPEKSENEINDRQRDEANRIESS